MASVLEQVSQLLAQSNPMVEVDRLTVDPAVIAEAAVTPPPVAQPAGQIQAVAFWNPATGAWQDTAPTVPVGTEARLRGLGANTSGAGQNMRMDITLTPPVGDPASAQGQAGLIPAGQGGIWEFRWNCPMAGVYKATLVLYAELA